MPAKTKSWSKETDEGLLKSKEYLERTIATLKSADLTGTDESFIAIALENCTTHIGYINDELSKRGI